MQIFIDSHNTGAEYVKYVVFFKGEGGTFRKPGKEFHTQLLEGCDTYFTHTDSNWRFDIVIPWKQLGYRPKKGDQWRINILSNPAVIRNRRVIWCQAYEWVGDPRRLGRIVFVE